MKDTKIVIYEQLCWKPDSYTLTNVINVCVCVEREGGGKGVFVMMQIQICLQ